MSNIINQIKRTILVVEDEIINQEILKEILGSQYDIITATNGLEAIHELTTSIRPISLIMLDLNMPTMDGIEFLNKIKEYNIKSIPIIVITSEADMELSSLELGATDFIKKPYDMPEIIKARVNKAIELFEDKLIISQAERDELTQVYNKNFFKEYVKKLDEYNPNIDMDLNVLDIENFHIISEIYGKEKSDEIIKYIADELKRYVKEFDGIVGRLEEDYFIMYHKHIENYANLIKEFYALLEEKYGITGVNFKLGIYEIKDKDIETDIRINRAKLVCDHISNASQNHYLVYNDSDQKDSLLHEQLVYDFPTSLKNREFSIYYQPKYNVEKDKYYISSSEALVRWNHSKYGMISPGIFIGLLEERGLIRELDKYVWEEAIKDLATWKKEGIKIVPVSLNVSRIDLLDDGIVSIFADLVKKYDVDSKYIYLEITESACNNNMNQLINTIEKLRDLGFKIEIDDFGAGYSSLNVLTTIPFDVLKLDMLFVRGMANNKTLKMIEIVAEIAKYLDVILVAEGVETLDQLNQLREYGYQVIQGYYFSKPLKKEEFYNLLGGKNDNN